MSARSKWIDLAVAIGTFAISGYAYAACDLVVATDIDPPLIEYRVFAFEEAIGSTELILRNAGNEECNASVTITDDVQSVPPFLLSDQRLRIDVDAPEISRADAEGRLPGRFPFRLSAGEERALRLDFVTDQIIAVPAGRYSRDVVFLVEEENATEPVARLRASLTLNVPPDAQINVAGSDGTFGQQTYSDRLDFGEAEPGERREVFVQTRSNTRAQLRIESDNGGRMIHSSAPDGFIAYETRLNGQIIDLTEPVIVPGLAATDLDGRSQPMIFTIEDDQVRYAGEYNDRIVLTIDAQ